MPLRYDWQRKNVVGIKTDDRKVATQWGIEALLLGYSLFQTIKLAAVAEARALLRGYVNESMSDVQTKKNEGEACKNERRTKMSGLSEKDIAELMAEYVPKVRKAMEADAAAKAEAAAKAKVVQLSVENGTERGGPT